MKIAAAVVLLLAARPALAESTIELVPTCVTIDDARDELPTAERPAARALLVRALERQDQLIVESDCARTIELWHERDGKNVIVHLRTTDRARKLTVSADDQMIDVYARMATSLLAAPTTVEPPAAAPVPAASIEPLEPPPPPSDSTPPSELDAPSAPPPASLEGHVWYARLGVGALAGVGGAGVIGGVRIYSAAATFDLSGVLMGTDEASSKLLRAQALHMYQPGDDSSGYIGGGLSAASVEVGSPMDGSRMTGGGVQLEGTVGFELHRRQATRIVFEANLSLPLFSVGDDYPLALLASVGWGK